VEHPVNLEALADFKLEIIADDRKVDPVEDG
jgi:hypothetical protein